mgnify:CR=1 FL=1
MYLGKTNFNFIKLVPDTNIETVLLSYGIDTGSKIMIIIQNFLKEKYDMDDITFEEHYKLTNKKRSRTENHTNNNTNTIELNDAFDLTEEQKRKCKILLT